jgi:hypothetical protein
MTDDYGNPVSEPKEKPPKKSGKETFTVTGIEKREYTLDRGNAGSTKLNLPPEWIGKKVAVILLD